MTICISAIAKDEDGEELMVFGTDHMVSTQIGQFEHSIKKYKLINKNIVAMLSGNTLLFERCINGVDKDSDFFSVREKIKQTMEKLRKEIIESEVYKVYNIDDNFVKEILKQQICNSYMDKILDTISKFSLSTSILLIGFDNNGKAQISEIAEEGYMDFRDVNFHAISSGTIQAINTLLFQRHSKENNLKTAIYNVFKAKKNAEVAEGVGRETEILILKKSGVTEIISDDLKILDKIYQEELSLGKNHQDLNTLKSINNYKVGEIK